jgi:DNA polymerase III epsilon subunit-like protein
VGKEKYQPEFWGLDLETSGSNYTHHATIQVGLIAPSGKAFNSLVGGQSWVNLDTVFLNAENPATWEEEAFAVHNISREALLDAPRRGDVDQALAAFILANTATDRVMNRIPVGWNVGGFDMQFFRKDFPEAGKLLSYRTADLNSIIFGMIRHNPLLDYNKIKDKVKKEAVRDLGELKWHDAEFDARAGLAALKVLAHLMGKEI